MCDAVRVLHTNENHLFAMSRRKSSLPINQMTEIHQWRKMNFLTSFVASSMTCFWLSSTAMKEFSRVLWDEMNTWDFLEPFCAPCLKSRTDNLVTWMNWQQRKKQHALDVLDAQIFVRLAQSLTRFNCCSSHTCWHAAQTEMEATEWFVNSTLSTSTPSWPTARVIFVVFVGRMIGRVGGVSWLTRKVLVGSKTIKLTITTLCTVWTTTFGGTEDSLSSVGKNAWLPK